MASLEEEPFTREQEHRLKALQEKYEKQELTEEEEMEYATLKQRNHIFLLEGEKRLREGAAQRNETIEQESTGSAIANSVVNFGKAAYFYTTLLATAVPGYVGQRTGVTPNFLHWNFITDLLMLGALPVVTPVGKSGNHLVMIHQQLMDRNKKLGMVAACLEMEEMKGYGLNMFEFATEESWRRFVSADIVYDHLPMLDTTANIAFGKVALAVEHMNECINTRKQVVYVHCKAGKGRSWMVVMCYLTSYGGMSYTKASELISAKRGQVSPSSSQEKFAREFEVNFTKWKSLKEHNSTQ